MWKKMTVISSVEVHVAFTNHEWIRFPVGDQSRSLYSDVEAAGPDWCPANKLRSALVRLTAGARCEMRLQVCSSKKKML